MNATAILLPMFALVALTFSVLILIPYQRFRAVAARRVTVGDFRFGESATVPGHVSIPNRNYMNLLELPLLFYAACLTQLVTHQVDALALNLAWAYVILRLLHSVVHLTYNNVVHRLCLFALSNFVLVGIWIRLFLHLGLGPVRAGD